MKSIKNAAGKIIYKVDEDLAIIEIQVKGCRTYLWFEHGHVFSLNEPIPPDRRHKRA
ncbi:hypothetical protein I4J37_00530 [Corynebacterium belfantii]|uniref:hypothetical protein n=1 Tax=Corynebacterium belfantii TaxID=2014537 RepID=UPI0018D37424|nr:hypothetical protein [Corynebacterium belfantii]MBG9318309.1 hypothetical protein [Corynebacterium belfantii]